MISAAPYRIYDGPIVSRVGNILACAFVYISYYLKLLLILFGPVVSFVSPPFFILFVQFEPDVCSFSFVLIQLLFSRGSAPPFL